MPVSDNRITALPTGFAGSYDDYIEQPLSLNELLIAHPAATFYFRITGTALMAQGVYDGDIAVVDRSLTPHPLDLILCIADGEFVVQEWQNVATQSKHYQHSASTNHEQEVIGVVTSLIRQLRRG